MNRNGITKQSREQAMRQAAENSSRNSNRHGEMNQHAERNQHTSLSQQPATSPPSAPEFERITHRQRELERMFSQMIGILKQERDESAAMQIQTLRLEEQIAALSASTISQEQHGQLLDKLRSGTRGMEDFKQRTERLTDCVSEQSVRTTETEKKFAALEARYKLLWKLFDQLPTDMNTKYWDKAIRWKKADIFCAASPIMLRLGLVMLGASMCICATTMMALLLFS